MSPKCWGVGHRGSFRWSLSRFCSCKQEEKGPRGSTLVLLNSMECLLKTTVLPGVETEFISVCNINFPRLKPSGQMVSGSFGYRAQRGTLQGLGFSTAKEKRHPLTMAFQWSRTWDFLHLPSVCSFMALFSLWFALEGTWVKLSHQLA